MIEINFTVNGDTTVMIQPLLALAPINSTVTFNCTIADINDTVRWYVMLQNASRIRAWPIDETFFKTEGINVSNTEHNVTLNGTAMFSLSKLKFVARVQRNGTIVQCAMDKNPVTHISQSVPLIVYGKFLFNYYLT